MTLEAPATWSWGTTGMIGTPSPVAGGLLTTKASRFTNPSSAQTSTQGGLLNSGSTSMHPEQKAAHLRGAPVLRARE